ncbi:MAG TPA: hypothetical protein DEP84_30715 [Chloroflexi bacterium]|nr:hypothetical protein [Chloroflexota bacterium]
MRLLNFTHPLTADHLAAIPALTGDSDITVREVLPQLDPPSPGTCDSQVGCEHRVGVRLLPGRTERRITVVQPVTVAQSECPDGSRSDALPRQGGDLGGRDDPAGRSDEAL